MVQIPSNSTAATEASTAAWAALAPQVTITSVTINSKPVVKFSVKDAAGNPVVGLGSKSKSATATVATMPNIAFTLAKLVPATTQTAGTSTVVTEPSKWVSYLVARPPTVAEKTAVTNASLCDAATNATWCGTYPATDSQGDLKDNGDGSYEYTFYRDVKQVAAVVASLPAASKDGLAKKADLGDVSYDASLTHRVGIQLGGNAPGTGSNTPNAVTVTPAVPMGTPANVVYDFRPDGGTMAATRNIVALDSCSGCHDAKVLAHGSRKDPNYCVTCHTDQIRYSFSQEASSTNGGLVLTGTTRQTTAVVNGRALGDFPNFIHKIHMGEELVKTGYFYNADEAVKFNEVTYPQPQTNCVKCHDGSAAATHKTANGDNWKNAPSLLACGACHDGINFATGKGVTLADGQGPCGGQPVGTTQSGHVGGAKANNSTCGMCHDANTTPDRPRDGGPDRLERPCRLSGQYRAECAHAGYPSGQGPSIPLASQLNLPAGVYKIGFEIKQATVSGAAGAKKATVVYRILKDGQAGDAERHGLT